MVIVNMKMTHRIVLGFTIVISMLLAATMSIYRVEQTTQHNQNMVKHSYEVIGKANLLHKIILDMETGQRGFLITGKSNFLEPFERGKKQYSKEIHNLIALVSDNPSQVDKLNKIDETFEKWIDEAAKPEIEARTKIGIIESQFLQIITIISKETGKDIMDSLREQVTSFVKTEQMLLQQRQENSHETISSLNKLILFWTIVGVIGGVLAMVLTIRYIFHQVGGEPEEVKHITKLIAASEWESVSIKGKEKITTGILYSVHKMGEKIKNNEQQNINLIQSLNCALEEVDELRGSIPICSHCKQIRDEKGSWDKVENYISKHSEAVFSHGICPKCANKHFPEFKLYAINNNG